MPKSQRNLLVYLIIIIVMVFAISKWFDTSSTEKSMYDVTTLNEKIKAEQVSEMVLNGAEFQGKLKDGTIFRSITTGELSKETIQLASEHGVKVSVTPPQGESIWITLLGPLIMLGAVLAMMFFFFSSMQGGNKNAMNFGKSKARLMKDDPKKRVTFADVAGLKEEKEELFEIVDFLKNPQKFAALGARIPKGILMVGLPGTGKTYLSKAIAGEAGVPFYSISGSDFVEMFVGVGASRVRDLFADAKKDAPCLVFIDEIDAVGRRRGAGLGGGNDEREQTLNQLLVEMDGFDDHNGIIIIAATNRPDILDPALLRPGRFDRQITVDVPDIGERMDIIRVHLRNKPVDPNLDLKVLARRTPGFTPADLENMLNEAALLAARRGEKAITMALIEEAITKVIVGVEKKSRIVTPKEKRLVSVHEAGHAVVRAKLDKLDPVHMVTIIPRGSAGGFTMHLPSEEINYQTKGQLEQELAAALGGRVAEKLFLGDISTGASSDLKYVSDMAKNMVIKYAMGDNLPQMAFSDEENTFIANDIMTRRDYSERVISDIDLEIQKIVDRAYNLATEILSENRDKLEEVAQALSEYETLYEKDFKTIMENGLEAFRAENESEPLEAPTEETESLE
ncbi:ATP-dependent zinc metalloprotease FtsH [Guggenheimella bovis]